MKNLIEILGGAQILLGLSFDLDVLFEQNISLEHKGFLALLRVIEEHLTFDSRIPNLFGRPRR